MDMKRTISSLVTVAMGLGFTACASRSLTPAPTAQQLSKDAARATDNDVGVVAEAGAWDGLDGMPGDVTPMRVSIENGSDQPVRVQYGNIRMVSAEGEIFPALPPINISGSAPLATPPDNYEPTTPAFAHQGFGVAP